MSSKSSQSLLERFSNWRSEHRRLCYMLTVAVLVMVLGSGLLLAQLAKDLSEPWDQRVYLVGEFLSKGAFLVLILDLFLLRISRRHLVHEFTDEVRLPIQHAVSKVTEDMKAETGSLNRLMKATIDRVDNAQSEIENQISDLRNEVTALPAQVASAFREVGFVNLLPQMSFGNLFRSLRSGQTLFFKDTFAPNWEEWLDDLVSAVLGGGNVLMLVINPKCAAARARAAQLNETLPDFMAQLHDFRAAMFRTRTKLIESGASGSLEIRTYNEPTNYPIYLIAEQVGNTLVPNRGYCSFFTDRPTGIAFPHFEIREPVLSSFFNDVAAMWDRNAPAA